MPDDLLLIAGLILLAAFYKLSAIRVRARIAKERERLAIDEILSYEALLREEIRLWGGGDVHVEWSTRGTDVRVVFVVNGAELSVDGGGRTRGEAIAEALLRLSRERQGEAGQPESPEAALVEAPRWWDVLGVGPDAGLREVERAYRSLAKRFHPDKGGSHEMMGRINLARDEAKLALGA